MRCNCDNIAKKTEVAVAITKSQKTMMRCAVQLRYYVKQDHHKMSYISLRPERWSVTIPSSDKWLATIGNHWKTIATNGFGDQKPS